MIKYLIVVLLTMMFFLSSFSKISDYSNVVKGFKKRFSEKLFNMPDISYNLAIISAICIQFLCPLIILYSVYNPKYYMYGFYATLSLIILTLSTRNRKDTYRKLSWSNNFHLIDC